MIIENDIPTAIPVAPVIVEKVVERVVYSSAPSRKFMYTIVFLAALAAQGVVHFLICA